MDDLLTREQFAERHDVTFTVVDNWIRRGMPHYKLHHLVRINEDEANVWLDNNVGITFIQAASIAGVSKDTVYYWRRNIPSFEAVLITSYRQNRISESRFREWLEQNRPLNTKITDPITIRQAAKLSNISSAQIEETCRNDPPFACEKIGVHGRYQQNGKYHVSKSEFLEWASKQ